MSSHLDADPCVDASGLLRTPHAQMSGGDRARDIGCKRAGARKFSAWRPLNTLGQASSSAAILVAIARVSSIDDALSQTPPNEEFAWSLVAEEIAARLDDAVAWRACAVSQPRRRRDRIAGAPRSTLPIERGGRSWPDCRRDPGGDRRSRGRGTSSGRRRCLAKQFRPAALRLIQRIAPKVLVRDLGVVDVEVGGAPLRSRHAKKGPRAAVLLVVTSRNGREQR